MKNRNYLFCVLLFCLCNRINSQELEQYVDTRVGTAESITQTAGLFGKHSEEYGQTLPAVLVPHGMNFWTPQTQDSENKCIAPYYYRDSKLQGFRNSHWIVGGCTQDYGSMTLMTITGELKTTPAKRASTFFHEKEIATPSYYSAYLEDYHTQAEMTAQSRSALFRFTYDKEGMAYLIVNPNSDEGEGYVEIDLEKHEIRGYNPVHRIYQGWGESAGFNGYFVVRFEKEPSVYGVYHDSLIYLNKKSIEKKSNIGAFIGFKVMTHEKVMVKVGSSFTDMNGASNNLDTEMPRWDFDQCRKLLEQCWEKLLSVLKVEGGSKDEKGKFYGALYRSSFLPRVFNDVDGRYPAFAKGTPICKIEHGDYYDDFSMWDTYRALHPLLTIIDPKRDGEMVQSLVEKYKQGGWLPIFPCWNSYTAAMIGDHSISVIGDAYMKGIKGFDIKTAYEAMRKNAFQSPASFIDYKNGMGRRALISYLKYGYIPLEDSVPEAFHENEQVSRTLEYAYDDYVLAQIARKLGKSSDYRLLAKRAKNWQNAINKQTGYAQGRNANGTFLKPGNEFSFVRFITEGAPCHYTWYVPQDVQGLVEWMGGKDKFISKLDSMFSEFRYWHGNEPCHQIGYLFNYVGEPWKTQKQISYIRNTEYLNAPGGLSGNDDAGQMSAWYVFSALGFYPVCPGNPYYVLGSPAFEKASIELENGNMFVVKARDVSAKNIYIQSATFNGKKFNKSYITHEQILKGGTLELIMGATPNKDWAAEKKSCPPSMSK